MKNQSRFTNILVLALIFGIGFVTGFTIIQKQRSQNAIEPIAARYYLRNRTSSFFKRSHYRGRSVVPMMRTRSHAPKNQSVKPITPSKSVAPVAPVMKSASTNVGQSLG